MYIHVSILPPDSPPIQAAHDIEQSSSRTVGPCWLGIQSRFLFITNLT